MLKKLTNLLFPNVCGICKRLSPNDICPKCGQLLKKLAEAKVQDCTNKTYEEYAYLFKYEGIIRERLIEYKFCEAGYLYKTFATAILKNNKMCSFIKKYDIIIPVPVHKKRKRQRGYNQTELVARKVSKELDKQFEIDVLIKTKNTKPQSTLNKEARKANAKDVYQLQNKEKISGKKILLLDDIFTTGSTASEASRVLLMAKPQKIGVLTIAKD